MCCEKDCYRSAPRRLPSLWRTCCEILLPFAREWQPNIAIRFYARKLPTSITRLLFTNTILATAGRMIAGRERSSFVNEKTIHLLSAFDRFRVLDQNAALSALAHANHD